MTHAIRNLAVFALLATSAVFAKNVAADQTPDVGAALATWEKAVESRDVSAIMKLYDKNAMMISTFAQSPMTRVKDIEGYFRKVAANDGVEVEILESHPRAYGDMAVNSGRYLLSYVQEGEEVEIPARFTFVYTLRDGQWVIVDQHASRMPEGKEKIQ